LIKIFY